MVRLEPWRIYPMCEAIREFLLQREEASPSDFYHEYKLFKKNLNYMNVARYFWMLNKLGLIKFVRHVPKPETDKSSRKPKSLYALIPEKLEDEMWLHPQMMFPSYRKRRVKK